MPNPLLNPQDDRFRRPTLPKDGENPFQEKEDALLPAGDALPPELPPDTYDMVYNHRGGFLAIMAGIGLAMEMSIVMAFVAPSFIWVMLALAGIFPGMTAMGLSIGDIRAMRAGAMDPEGLSLARAAFWMGLCATVLPIAGVFAIVAVCVGLLL